MFFGKKKSMCFFMLRRVLHFERNIEIYKVTSFYKPFHKILSFHNLDFNDDLFFCDRSQ